MDFFTKNMDLQSKTLKIIIKHGTFIILTLTKPVKEYIIILTIRLISHFH